MALSFAIGPLQFDLRHDKVEVQRYGDQGWEHLTYLEFDQLGELTDQLEHMKRTAQRRQGETGR